MYLMDGNNVIVGCKMVRLDDHDKTLQSIISSQKLATEYNESFIIHDIKIISQSDKFGSGIHFAYIFYTGEFPEIEL